MEIAAPKNKASALIDSQAREEQAEADALFLSIGEGAIVTDAAGRVNRVNQVALDILGFTRDELMGKWYPGTVIAEDSAGKIIANYNRPITQVFLTGEPVTARLYYRRKDLSVVPVSLTVAPVLLHDKPIGSIEVFRDITNELALEQAKDDFISIASHQLRTPATGVKQYAGMLLEGYAGKLTPKQRKLLERAYESNERQLGIIEDLLNVARLDAGNLSLNVQKTDLVRLLNEVILELSTRTKNRNQSITFTHPQRVIPTRLDNARMRMVFENILDNAIKYTPEGRKITVKAYLLKSQNVIKVYDQGVGIAAEDMDKLFQKFQRIPNDLSIEAGGAGLGLYWAEKIVNLHGGKITISSRPGKGTCFSVYLPNIIDSKITESKLTMRYTNNLFEE